MVLLSPPAILRRPRSNMRALALGMVEAGIVGEVNVVLVVCMSILTESLLSKVVVVKK
jgi:hypothetical protein